MGWKHITIERPEEGTPCKCGGCEWSGPAAHLNEIGDVYITAGDPTPAGRCPECDSLAYVDTQKSRLMSMSSELADLLSDAMDYSESATLEHDPLPSFVEEGRKLLEFIEGKK